MRLNALIRRVEKVRGTMEATVQTACRRERAWIVKANREQLSEGLNTDGQLMNDGIYSVRHSRARVRKGLKVDHVYLSFDGALQKEMTVDFGLTGFSVRSNDKKQWMVDEVMRTGWWPSDGNAPHYGPVFGLTGENKRLLGHRIAPRVVKKIRKTIHG